MIYSLSNIPKGRVEKIDIDIPSHMRQKVFDVLTQYFESIGGSIVRVATFGTETAKSAIRTSGRGLGVNSDVLNHLSSLIPMPIFSSISLLA